MIADSPSDFRSTMDQDPSGNLEIVIPVRRRPIVIGLLTVFLGLQSFWLLFFVMLLVAHEREVALAHGHHTFTRIFAAYMPFWLSVAVQMLIWLVLTGGGLYQWGWHLFGREIIRIDGSKLIVRREFGWFDDTREFDLDAVRDLRYERPDQIPWLDPWLWHNPLDDYERGCLVFAYQYKGYLEKTQFGDDLDEAEARSLIQTIEKRVRIPHHNIENQAPIA